MSNREYLPSNTYATASPELVHKLEALLKRALLQMLPHDTVAAATRAADGTLQLTMPAGYMAVEQALLIVERGLRDQLEEPIFVSKQDLVGEGVHHA